MFYIYNSIAHYLIYNCHHNYSKVYSYIYCVKKREKHNDNKKIETFKMMFIKCINPDIALHISNMNDVLSKCSDSDRPMLKSAFNVISKNNYWSFMSEYTPDEGKGFMWSSHPKLNEIRTKITNEWSHSGASLAYTMRVIEMVAKKKS